MLEHLKLCHCVHHPWKPPSRDFWSSRNDRNPLSQQKCVLRKCCGESQKWWVLELSKLCHCVQHPGNLNGRDFWSFQNKRKPLSKQKSVLRKCCRVPKNGGCIELLKLCHCVQHPCKPPSRDFWSSRNERKPLSKQKCVLRKCCRESQIWWGLELSKLCHCVQLHLNNLLVGIFGALRKKRKTQSHQKYVLRKWCGVSQKLWLLEHFAIVFSTHENLLSKDYWSSRNERKTTF